MTARTHTPATSPAADLVARLAALTPAQVTALLAILPAPDAAPVAPVSTPAVSLCVGVTKAGAACARKARAGKTTCCDAHAAPVVVAAPAAPVKAVKAARKGKAPKVAPAPAPKPKAARKPVDEAKRAEAQARAAAYRARKSTNREIVAPALRAAGLAPTGPAWAAAKAVMAEGGTVETAVAAALVLA